MNDYSLAQKVIYHTEGGSYVLYTGEARIAKFLDLAGELWIRPGKWFDVGHAVRYRPDFYLPRLNLYIEVKNMNPEDLLAKTLDIEKMRLFYESGYDLFVIDSPVIDTAFAYEKYISSNKTFFSSKYIHAGLAENDFVMFCKRNGKLSLGICSADSPVSFLEEAINAKHWEFPKEDIPIDRY